MCKMGCKARNLLWRERQVRLMHAFYDEQSMCWFLKLNGLVMYIPDPDKVWDMTSLDKAVVMHVDHVPGREHDLVLQTKLGKLIPVYTM